jgi:dTDP-4-amino-4,6-dideoxygalactose transaminase
MGFASGDFPEAERYYCEAISLPIYPGLSDDDINKVVEALKIAISK